MDTAVDGHTVEDIGWTHAHDADEFEPLRQYVGFDWKKIEAWYEEDDEVFVHPRDPYHRVDVLNSSRHIKVMLDGEVIAETRRPRLLFETGSARAITSRGWTCGWTCWNRATR